MLLGSINRSLNDIDAILITHEHIDHIKGLKVIAKRYNVPIFANKETWIAIDQKNIPVPSEQRFEFNPLQTKEIIGMDIQSFNVSHDAINPQFYTMTQNDKNSL